MFGAAIVEAADFTNFLADITANLDVLIPIGLTLCAIMLGVSLIPRIIYKFF